MGAAAPPVVEAVKDGKIDTVRALLAQRADPNAAEADGTTALHWAAHFDNLAAADLLIKAGANARAANRYGATPLWLACINGSAADGRAAADRGRRSEHHDAGRRHGADDGGADRQRCGGAARCSTRGADVNAPEKWKGQTALMWAAAGNNAAAVEALD